MVRASQTAGMQMKTLHIKEVLIFIGRTPQKVKFRFFWGFSIKNILGVLKKKGEILIFLGNFHKQFFGVLKKKS